jgi:hypothetical protein
MMQLDDGNDDIPLSQLRRRSSGRKEVEDDLDIIPLDREIERLRTLTREKGKTFRKGYPKHSMKVVVLPRPDLFALHRGFTAPFKKTDEQLLVWLRSASVLPLLKQWYEQCIDVRETFWQIQRLLLPQDRPWDARVEQVVDFAQLHGVEEFNPPFQKNGKAFVLCVNFAAKIARANPNLFEGEKPYGFPKNELLRASVLVLFTTYHDLIVGGPGSFFMVLLKSELAGSIAPAVRPAWEKKYVFEGADQMKKGVEQVLINPQTIRVSDSRLRDAARSSVDQPSSSSADGPAGKGRDQGVRRSRFRRSQREVTTDEELATTDAEQNGASEEEVDDERDGNVEDEVDDDEDDDGYSSDGIPEHGEAAIRGLRAKANGLEDANRKILNLYKASQADLEDAKQQIQDLEMQLAAANARPGVQTHDAPSAANGGTFTQHEPRNIADCPPGILPVFVRESKEELE